MLVDLNYFHVYRYIDLGRLPAYKSSGVFLLAEEDVRQFKLNLPGRTRSEPPRGRVYHPRSTMLVKEIRVPVRIGQQDRLAEKLKVIQQDNRHTFPGTIARSIIKGNPELTSIHLILAWKDTEMPDESIHQRSLKALQEELADVLEWERAQYSTNEALMHT